MRKQLLQHMQLSVLQNIAERPPAWLRDYAYQSALNEDRSETDGVDDIASIISPDGQ